MMVVVKDFPFWLWGIWGISHVSLLGVYTYVNAQLKQFQPASSLPYWSYSIYNEVPMEVHMHQKQDDKTHVKNQPAWKITPSKLLNKIQ